MYQALKKVWLTLQDRKKIQLGATYFPFSSQIFPYCILFILNYKIKRHKSIMHLKIIKKVVNLAVYGHVEIVTYITKCTILRIFNKCPFHIFPFVWDKYGLLKTKIWPWFYLQPKFGDISSTTTKMAKIWNIDKYWKSGTLRKTCPHV